MKIKRVRVDECCVALKERLDCNGWNGIWKYSKPRVLVGISVFSYCPFCGKKITTSNKKLSEMKSSDD